MHRFANYLFNIILLVIKSKSSYFQVIELLSSVFAQLVKKLVSSYDACNKKHLIQNIKGDKRCAFEHFDLACQLPKNISSGKLKH